MRWRQIIISPPARTPICSSCKTHSMRNCGQNLLGGFEQGGEKSCLLMVHAPQLARCNGRCPLRVRLPRSLVTAWTPSPARSAPHTGTDIACAEGTPILAAADGTVTVANSLDSWGGSYGYYIQIDHGGGLETLYAHCSSICVTTGQQVQAGEVIGYVGHTGRATGKPFASGGER